MANLIKLNPETSKRDGNFCRPQFGDVWQFGIGVTDQYRATLECSPPQPMDSAWTQERSPESSRFPFLKWWPWDLTGTGRGWYIPKTWIDHDRSNRWSFAMLKMLKLSQLRSMASLLSCRMELPSTSVWGVGEWKLLQRRNASNASQWVLSLWVVSDIRYESIWHDCSVWSIGNYWGSTDPESNSPQLFITFAFSAQWTVTMDPGWNPSPLQPVPQHSHFGGTAPCGTAGADLHDLQVINHARCFACYLIKSDKQIFWHFRCLQVHPTLPMELWSDASFCSDTSWSDRPDPSLLPRTQRRLVWLGTPIHQVVPSLFMFIQISGISGDSQISRNIETAWRDIPVRSHVCIWLYYDIMICNLYNLARNLNILNEMDQI